MPLLDVAWREALVADVRRQLVRRHPLDLAHPGHDRGDLAARRFREPLIGHRLDELADPQPAGVARSTAGRQRVVGADALVAIGDGAFLAQEQANTVKVIQAAKLQAD